mgnify:FL=1
MVHFKEKQYDYSDVERYIWKSGDDDETEKTLVLYLKDDTVLDLCDDGAFSSEQGDFEKAQRQTGPQS